MPMVVRHYGLRRLAGANLFAADDERNLDSLLRHRVEAFLERLLLRRARAVAFDGLVHWCRHAANASESGERCARGRDRTLGLLRLGGGASGRTRVALGFLTLGGCDGGGHDVLDVNGALGRHSRARYPARPAINDG